MTFGRIRWQGVALLCALVPPGCTAAHVSGEQAVPAAFAMSAGRLGAIVGVLVGLTGVVIGGRALTRSAGIGSDKLRRGAMAVVAGLLGMALAALVIATSAGGVGTGHGAGGAIVAMVVGLISMVLGGLALARSRRTE